MTRIWFLRVLEASFRVLNPPLYRNYGPLRGPLGTLGRRFGALGGPVKILLGPFGAFGGSFRDPWGSFGRP